MAYYKDTCHRDYSYVPNKITVGMFNGTDGFVTCKYKGEKWLQVSIFERLCGFKPHRQLSCEKEIKKALAGVVFEHDNVPTEGFKFCAADNDLYKFYHKYGSRGDVVLEDPRGFNIAITEDNFFSLLSSSGFNIKDRVILRKLAYAWSDRDCRFLLVDAETDKFNKTQEASSKIINAVDTMKYLTKKQLQVGHIYLTKTGDKYMYLGEHPTYSGRCHLNAYDNGCYSLESYLADRTDMTRENSIVLFRLDDKTSKLNEYVLQSSCSKMFTKELDEDGSDYKYRDITCTYENIKQDMAFQLLFNKLDFKRLTYCNNVTELVSLDTFRKVLFNKSYDQYLLPQGFYWRTSWFMSETYKYLKSYNTSFSNNDKVIFREYRSSSSNRWWSSSYLSSVEHEYYMSDFRQAYADIKPLFNVLYFENGNKVRDYDALCFIKKEVRDN